MEVGRAVLRVLPVQTFISRNSDKGFTNNQVVAITHVQITIHKAAVTLKISNDNTVTKSLVMISL